MNTKSKLTLAIAALVAMIVIMLAVAIGSMQILTAMEPDSMSAEIGLNRALIWVCGAGIICLAIGMYILVRIPNVVGKPLKDMSAAIKEVANHNYQTTLNLGNSPELEDVSKNFNRMVKRLNDYHNSTISDLMASKRYMDAIINSINEPIIGLDNDMNVLFINNEALKVVNLKREDILKKSAQEVSLHNDLLRRLIRGLADHNAAEKKKAQDAAQPKDEKVKEKKEEPLKIYADNKESYFQVKYMDIFVKAKDGINMEKIGSVVMLKNITEFQELDTAKTTFISTISHELKTPISSILMSLQLLEDKRVGKLNPEQEELSQSIKENSERLLNITGELLNMTQVESGKLQLKPKITRPIELIDYAIKANRVQAEKFGIQIEVDYPQEGNIGKLFVDSEKIAWVLTNLLSNAIHYSSENSRVVIGAKQLDGHHIEMYVKDFGKGIAPRYHESIFDHYFRVPGTKVQGSGLGLAISRDFVEAHNGTLTVESELGKGSRFVMVLPS